MLLAKHICYQNFPGCAYVNGMAVCLISVVFANWQYLDRIGFIKHILLIFCGFLELVLGK